MNRFQKKFRKFEYKWACTAYCADKECDKYSCRPSTKMCKQLVKEFSFEELEFALTMYKNAQSGKIYANTIFGCTALATFADAHGGKEKYWPYSRYANHYRFLNRKNARNLHERHLRIFK